MARMATHNPNLNPTATPAPLDLNGHEEVHFKKPLPFSLPKPAISDDNHLAPPRALGHALKSVGMISSGLQNGVGHPLSDTPLPSAPSTAPSSPRL